jgi:hypothetical protein
MGSIPIARSIDHDESIGFTLLTCPESDANMDRFGLKLDRTEVNWTELFRSALTRSEKRSDMSWTEPCDRYRGPPARGAVQGNAK